MRRSWQTVSPWKTVRRGVLCSLVLLTSMIEARSAEPTSAVKVFGKAAIAGRQPPAPPQPPERQVLVHDNNLRDVIDATVPGLVTTP